MAVAGVLSSAGGAAGCAGARGACVSTGEVAVSVALFVTTGGGDGSDLGCVCFVSGAGGSAESVSIGAVWPV